MYKLMWTLIRCHFTNTFFKLPIEIFTTLQSQSLTWDHWQLLTVYDTFLLLHLHYNLTSCLLVYWFTITLHLDYLSKQYFSQYKAIQYKRDIQKMIQKMYHLQNDAENVSIQIINLILWNNIDKEWNNNK